MLKDDTLGLGAKRNNGDECTGLDAFQHLLGRLNGKSDETLETERKVREDLKLNLYVERKFGTIRFVKGGWLVGDQVKDTPDDEVKKSQDGTEPDASEDSAVESRKRKADQDTDREDEKARKKEKKSKKRKTQSDPEVDGESSKEKKPKKKSKTRKDKEEPKEDSAQSTSAISSEAAETAGEIESSAEADKAKKEKRDKKKDKRDKKEKKERRKKDKAASDTEAETSVDVPKEKKRKNHGVPSETASPAITPAESGISTPNGSGYSTPVPTGSSRYLARSRFIAQKKMAFADTAALNQVRQ